MSRVIIRLIRQQSIGVLALLLVLGGLANAATGGKFTLGGSNKANTTSALQNTGAGPALSLKAKAGEPALAVNTNRIVPHLNAQLLGGRRASSFARAVGSPAYLSSGGTQLLDYESYVGVNAGTFFDRELKAPASGSITVQVIGACVVSSSNLISLSVSAGVTNNVLVGIGTGGTSSVSVIGCNISVKQTVVARESVTVTAGWAIQFGTPSINNATVLVLFHPE